MKRILILLLVLVLSLAAFASCEKINELFGKEPTVDPTPETPTPAVDADLKAAYDYIHQMTKDVAKVTGANYTVFTSAKIGEKTYQVKWEVNVDSVTITPNEDGVTATVNVPSDTNVDIPYTLKYTVTNEKGESLSRSYEHVVPKFQVNTHEEYLAAESGTNLVVEGIVVAINSKSAGNTRNHLFLADANTTGGYYIYQIDVADPVADLGIQVGMTVRVTGPASPYNGMQEIKGGVPEIIDSTIKTVAPVDITDLFASGADLGKYVGLPVTIKGVTVGGQKLGGSNDYLYFALNGKEAYLRSYKTDFPTTLPASAKEVIEAAHAAHYNWTADVTGILILYSGNPYLIPMTEDCFNYLQAKELTDAEKVADSLNNITLPSDINADTTVELPLTGKNYSEVTFTWTVNSTDFNIGADGKMPITLGSSAVTLKLTVTATCGEATDTKEFTVNLAASLVMNEKHAYSTYLNQVTAGKVLYLDGGVDGRYLTTTTDPSKGVAVYAEQATGGYKLYILVEGAKQYITIYNNAEGKTSVNYDAAGETVFTYNKSVNAWTTVFGGKEVYLGCYNSFETVSVSNLSYITPENTGVSQFPLEILDVAVNTPINMFVNQVTNGTVLYLDGGVSGRYLTTTNDLASAVAVYAEKVTGGYKFYILVEGAKQYITIYNNAEGKTSVNYDAAGETVYTYNPTVNAWTTVFGGKDVYLGTYSNFATISVSNLSYITPENTGVSQFPLDVVAGTPASTPSCTHTNTTTSTTDATCTVAGSTTVTCTDCGEVVSTTEIPATGHAWADATCVAPKTCGTCQATEGEAAGHNFVEGTCSVCGTPETHVCNFVAGETVDPTCTEAGYTVYSCTCGATENRDEVAATGHTELTETNPASCSAAGSTVVTCEVCEETLSTTVLPQLDHTWGTEGVYTNATCSAAGFTTFTCVNCTATNKVTDDNAPATGHSDNNGDFKCDTCSAVVEPEAGSVLTLAQAQALAKLFAHNTYTTNKYYVVVTVKEVYNASYGNMYVSDDTVANFTVYGTYSADGSTKYDAMATKPVAYDTVKLYGVIGTYSNAAQMKNAWIVEHTPHVCSDFSEATCTAAPLCTVCGKENGEKLGHNLVEGQCTRCEYNEAAASEEKLLATFECGTATADQSAGKSSYSEKDGDYTLKITSTGGKMYDGYDTNNKQSGLKFGSSSAKGDGTISVDANVTKVVIYIARYGSDSTKVTINGTQYTLTGQYQAIEVTQPTAGEAWTIAISAVNASKNRFYINTVEFYGFAI